MLQKLKSFLANDQLFYGVLLVLVALASFGLGRQSVSLTKDGKNVENQASIATFVQQQVIATSTPTKPTETESAAVPAVEKAVAVVGSKSGTKYHLPTCSGAKRIKPENLISFETIEAAKAAGYSAAANCPGLNNP
jgi:hypothetical protein